MVPQGPRVSGESGRPGDVSAAGVWSQDWVQSLTGYGHLLSVSDARARDTSPSGKGSG